MMTTTRRKTAKIECQDEVRDTPLLPVQELLFELAIAMHATVAVGRLPERKVENRTRKAALLQAR